MMWPAINFELLTEEQIEILIYLIRAFLAVWAVGLGMSLHDYIQSKKEAP